MADEDAVMLGKSTRFRLLLITSVSLLAAIYVAFVALWATHVFEHRWFELEHMRFITTVSTLSIARVDGVVLIKAAEQKQVIIGISQTISNVLLTFMALVAQNPTFDDTVQRRKCILLGCKVRLSETYLGSTT